MTHSIRTDIAALRSVLTPGLIFIAVLATVYVFAVVMFGIGQSVSAPARPVALNNPAQSAHCSLFVAHARAKFGLEWKRRLDPSGTACAQQIQEAWERDWSPRKAPPEPVLQPTTTASAARPAKVAPLEARPAHDPENYSLSAAAISTGAGVRSTSADAADQESANGSSGSSQHGADFDDAAREDRDAVGMDTETDATRALNNAQLRRISRTPDDMQGTSDVDSDAYQFDESGDNALLGDSD